MRMQVPGIVVRGRLALFSGGLFLTVLAAVGALAVFVFQPFGDRGWAFAGVSALLAASWLPRAPRWRLPAPARAAVAGGLVCWLGLITWAAASPGGSMPPPKTDPAAIRVLTWNILVGNEGGLPWGRHGWPLRKRALESALLAARPDILCVQEALDSQVRFLDATLPDHGRAGVGRDDGRSAGEHCAIYFDRRRFEPLASGTFWLEPPTTAPPAPGHLLPKRICTWVRLRDRHSGRTLRVYNSHLYLTERARMPAARIILDQIAAGGPADSILLAGDFNAPPSAPSRRLFAAAGLVSTVAPAGQPPAATYQFYGIRLKCIDDILVSRDLRVEAHQVVDVKPENTFPSDHFGILADVALGDHRTIDPARR